MTPQARAALKTLGNLCTPGVVSRQLRILQPYLVEVYTGQLDRLKHANALTELPSGVLLLDEGSYDEAYGLLEQTPLYIL